MATDPVSYIPTLSGPSTTTPGYQKSLEEYAKALMKQESPRKPGIRYTWANGLNDAGGHILGAMMLRRAQDQELAREGKGTLPIPGTVATPTTGMLGASAPVSPTAAGSTSVMPTYEGYAPTVASKSPFLFNYNMPPGESVT